MIKIDSFLPSLIDSYFYRLKIIADMKAECIAAGSLSKISSTGLRALKVPISTCCSLYPPHFINCLKFDTESCFYVSLIVCFQLNSLTSFHFSIICRLLVSVTARSPVTPPLQRWSCAVAASSSTSPRTPSRSTPWPRSTLPRPTTST